MKIVEYVKFLWVYISYKLSQSEHINHESRQVAKGVGVLSQLKHILPRHVLRSWYQTLIMPHLTYCCIVSSGASHQYLKKLIVLQKRAIRHITLSGYYDHTNLLFTSHNLLKFSDFISLNMVQFVYGSQGNPLPPSLNIFFTTVIL